MKMFLTPLAPFFTGGCPSRSQTGTPIRAAGQRSAVTLGGAKGSSAASSPATSPTRHARAMGRPYESGVAPKLAPPDAHRTAMYVATARRRLIRWRVLVVPKMERRVMIVSFDDRSVAMPPVDCFTGLYSRDISAAWRRCAWLGPTVLAGLNQCFSPNRSAPTSPAAGHRFAGPGIASKSTLSVKPGAESQSLMILPLKVHTSCSGPGAG
jgi:hypothetical protein